MCAVCSVHDCMCIYIFYMRILSCIGICIYIYYMCDHVCAWDLHHIMQWFLCASPSCWYYFACMTIFEMGVIKHSENVGFPLAPLLSAFSQTVELEDAPRASHPTASDLTGGHGLVCDVARSTASAITHSLHHCVPTACPLPSAYLP